MAHQQSQVELQQHLNEQLSFLKLSAKAFDDGIESEGKRLAQALRVLLHDTPASASLLGQLNLKNQFWDSSMPAKDGSVATHGGLVVQVMSKTHGSRYQAFLDDVPPPACAQLVAFDAWWRNPVFVDNQGRQISRKDIVLWISNQDGGAHVAPQLTASYADLSRNNSLGWEQDGTAGWGPIRAAELAAVRQITHEILKSLEPGYALMPTFRPTDTGLMAGMSVTLEQSPTASVNQPVRASTKVGRNDPCTCGSGQKWKKCHGA